MSARWKVVELGRVLDQHAMPRRLVRHPHRQQVEQHGIVRLLVHRFARMRPIAAPNHTLRCRARVALRDGDAIGILRRPDLVSA